LGVIFAGKISSPRDLKRFLRWAQNVFGLRIKKNRSDKKTEFKNSHTEGFLEEEGIKHEFSSPTHLNKMELWREQIELSWIW
jgi:hypothetical protein